MSELMGRNSPECRGPHPNQIDLVRIGRPGHVAEHEVGCGWPQNGLTLKRSGPTGGLRRSTAAGLRPCLPRSRLPIHVVGRRLVLHVWLLAIPSGASRRQRNHRCVLVRRQPFTSFVDVLREPRIVDPNRCHVHVSLGGAVVEPLADVLPLGLCECHGLG